MQMTDDRDRDARYRELLRAVLMPIRDDPAPKENPMPEPYVDETGKAWWSKQSYNAAQQTKARAAREREVKAEGEHRRVAEHLAYVEQIERTLRSE